MTGLLSRLQPRQRVLAVMTLTMVLGAALVNYVVLPVYDEWRGLSSQVELEALEYRKLTANLEARQYVNAEFGKLGEEVWQLESDQITLSRFLRDVEALARHPSLTVINMKPMPVEDKGSYKVYPVRLSVAGKLQEVLQFVSDMTNRATVVGMDGFAIRGIQGSNMVECSISIWMVRLVSGRGTAEGTAHG